MDDRSTGKMELTVGLDLSDRSCQLCVLDESGAIIEEARLTLTPAALKRRFEGAMSALMVLEAGAHSPWVSRLLADLGHEVVVANPRKVRLIYDNDSKSDRIDAEYLARLGRLDPALLRPIVHRDAQAQADLAVLRSRDVLVKTRTCLICHVRGTVKATGARIPSCSAPSFSKIAAAHSSAELTSALGPVIEAIAELTDKIRAADRAIEELCRAPYTQTGALMQVPGVGPVTALTFVLTIEDPARFTNNRAIGSYLGLRPRQAQSGAKNPELHITKSGDRMLRCLLVGAAQYILGPFGPDTDLRRWGLTLAGRGGKAAKKRAVVAVARKLSVLLLSLWVTGEVYEPLRNSTEGDDAAQAA